MVRSILPVLLDRIILFRVFLRKSLIVYSLAVVLLFLSIYDCKIECTESIMLLLLCVGIGCARDNEAHRCVCHTVLLQPQQSGECQTLCEHSTHFKLWLLTKQRECVNFLVVSGKCVIFASFRQIG